MDTNLKVFVLAAIFVGGISMIPAFGQIPEPIAIATDKASYAEGETIMVSGEVRDLLSGQPVSLKVTAPNGNVVALDQVNVGADKTFSTEIIAGGTMKEAGVYTIDVTYGSETRTAQTTFTFGGSVMMPEPEEAISSIRVSDTEERVEFSITGGTVISIEPDFDGKALIINIDATDDGSLTITLPRTIIDSLSEDGTDDEFFVLVDGEERDFDETKTSTDRTLTISFEAGAEMIEIIGTFVIPEFGTIAAIILAVAIISIVAFTARSRLSIMPRY